LGKENQAINDLGALAKKNKEQAADRKRKQQRRWGD
jgi:hypothetical protein